MFSPTARSTGKDASSFTLEMKVLQRGGRKARQCAFIGTSYRAILHFLSSVQQSSLTFSLFTHRIPLLSLSRCSFSFFPLAPSRVPFPRSFLLTFCERTIPPVRSSIEQITFWVAPPSTRRSSSHPRPFFPPFRRSCPSSFGNLDGYRPLLIFTIRGAISPSFHRAVIKWALLIVPDTKDRILEVYLFLVVERAQNQVLPYEFSRCIELSTRYTEDSWY